MTREKKPRNRSRSLALAGIALLLTLPAALAAGDRPAAENPAAELLTLERAVQLALAGNPGLAAAEASEARATAARDEARSARLPVVELSHGALATTNPTLAFSARLGQEAFTQADFEPARLNEPDRLTNFATRLSVSQPLWTGGRLSRAIGAAGFAADAVAAERERVRQEVAFQALDAFAGAVAAEGGLEAAEKALETARAHTALAADLWQAGLVVESDLLAAEVRVAELEEVAVLAEAELAVSRAALNVALGLPQDSRHRLAPVLQPGARVEEQEDLAALLAGAAAARPDLAAARARVQAAEEAAGLAAAGRLPSLGLSGSWEANSEDLLGAGGSNWSVSLGLRWTLFDGFGRRARIEEAAAARREAESHARAAGEAAALEVRRAFHEQRAAERRFALAEKAVAQAARSLEIVHDRYREGLVPLVELLDAETALTAARSRRVAAERDLVIAGAALALATGRL